MPRPFITALAAANLLAAANPGLACEAATHLAYNAPATLEGTLKPGKGEHDAQGAFTYTYLQLDAPVCVDADGTDEFNVTTQDPVTRIQLAGEAAAKDLPMDSHAAVEGTLFGAHTMWHVEDVLIDATSITPK
jgi:hypothetical protein